MQEPFKLDHLLRPSRRRHAVEQFLKNAEYTHSLVTVGTLTFIEPIERCRFI